MNVDLAGLLRNAAKMVRTPDQIHGPMVAFALEEAAVHVDMVRRGEGTLAEFCDLYLLQPESPTPAAPGERER